MAYERFLLYMNIIFLHTFSVFCIFFKRDFPPEERVQLIAITHFSKLENYYNILQQRSSTECPSQIKKSVKETICKNILSSSYFYANGVDWIDPTDKKIRAELESNYKEIFHLTHEITNKPFSWLSANKCMYVNEHSYKLFPVWVNNIESYEYVFICLVRDRQSKTIKEYFISKEYNVNVVLEPYITGRFIFSYNDENELVVRALAEEPATLNDAGKRLPNNDEWQYFGRRRLINIGESEYEDPICLLTASEKIRLCSTVLNSWIFRHNEKVEFLPNVNNVEGCKKREVQLVDKQVKKLAGKNVYEEWTITCRANNVNKHEDQINYYLCRGYESNRVFVYEGSHVKYYMNNVSVMNDKISNSGGDGKLYVI